MKHSTLFISAILASACIQNTYEYPDCDTDSSNTDIEDVSDIPSPSQDLDDSNTDSSTGDSSSDSPDTEGDEEFAKAITYFFDDAQSLLYVQVYKDPSAFGSGLAHDHVMRATNWNGEVTYNTDYIEDCDMSFSLPVNDLAVDEDAMRELVGYGDTINQNDRSQIREHMLDDNQLNATQYDSIWFESTRCEEANGGLIVTGDMFIAGTTTEMEIDISVTPANDKFYMTGVIDFTHADFNMTPYEAFWGAVRNAEPLKITFDMVGFAG